MSYFTKQGSKDTDVVAWRCGCSYINAATLGYCWKCKVEKATQAELLYPRDFNDNGGCIKPFNKYAN